MGFDFCCPYCKSKLEAEDDWEGKISDCPSCGKQLIIQRDDGNAVGNGENHDKIHVKDMKVKADETIRKTFELEKLEGFSFSRFMGQMFKRHPWGEIEDYLTFGTPRNTPRIDDVNAAWPAPWLFFRVMVLTVLLYLFIVWRADFFGRIYVVMPLLFTGVIGIPLAALLFFWEINIPRNVSVLSLVRIMLVSGFVSVAITVLLHKYVAHPESAIWAGPIEESAKLLTMMLFVRNGKYRFKLNGLLIGAAVGAGFAIIETGGYVLNAGNDGTMELRAVLSPLGHIPYSAIVGFALWRVKGKSGFSFYDLMNQKFISLFALAIGLHMFWNSNLLKSEFLIKCAIVAVIEYVVIIYLTQNGINEIRELKADSSVASHETGADAPSQIQP